MIPAEKAVEILREILQGKRSLEVVGRAWNAVYAGNVEFRAGDARLVFFNDCDELDYLASIETPEGRGQFDDWFRSDCEANPVSLLGEEEYRRLEDMLENAKESRSIREEK